MVDNYYEKRAAKAERYEELAQKNLSQSNELYDKAHKMASCIPFGQPILVGHHSEKRDRNFRNKIHNTYEKSFNALDKAKYYENKAKNAVNNTAISSDAPDVIQRLEEKIQKLTEMQEFYKLVNKKYREYMKKGDKTDFTGLEDTVIEQIKTFKPDLCRLRDIPFPRYITTNNNQCIRNAKIRLEDLKRKANDVTTKQEYDGFTVVDNVEENRVQFLFGEIPDVEIRQTLKSYGFKWSPTNKAWQRMRGCKYTTKSVIEFIQNHNQQLSA